ncbi:uncharacterized protein LOC109529840 [Hippocampus comes]|uniref:uncharacterized protein LOC109529840 n=1 Tax=Hippocampus comes TaxID=109280 RepID=UPI00094ED065|nr:PREDICTED: uncharacterized protein LOC109529840 [Hippocampus comes]XP_019748888.1 PREDICTED: uncharacterized protein LOC109529840 [Hippocampus comes]
MDEIRTDAGNAEAPSADVPPPLKQGETFHVFISYSSTDYQWTHSLIQQLEAQGLHVCYHERDFTAGRTILENMSECIQDSQKVLLVLSSEFVRSRWCLLEANMSLFRDCLERKPIVPVLLEPAVCVPLHLCHLTYLEARDADFMAKLLKVLFTPNRQLQGSTVVPYQPPSIYNGKALQPLTAANVESLYKWDAGQFSDMDVPDQLRLIIEDPEKYRKAIAIINSVSPNKVWLRPLWIRAVVYVAGVIAFLSFMVTFLYATAHSLANILPLTPSHFPMGGRAVIIICFFPVPIGLLIHLSLWKNDDEKHVVREMQKAAGQANAILMEEKLLMGCRSNSIIYLAYVSLDDCKREFTVTFEDPASAEELFKIALVWFSSGYACCLAKRHFPFPQPCPGPGHLEGGVCFCQYVSQQLSRGEWK